MTQKAIKSSARHTNRAQIERRSNGLNPENSLRVLPRRPSSGAHRKTSDSATGLTRRQAIYVAGRAAGKNKRQAALDAGYAPSTADNALQCIEGPHLRTEFQKVIRTWFSAQRLAQIISEGLNATQIRTFSHVLGSRLKGTERIELSHVETIDFEQRRKYLELAVKYGGYYIEKEQIEIEGSAAVDSGERIAELLNLALERAKRAGVVIGSEGSGLHKIH